MRVAVIGAGSFGTVLADIAAHNRCDVKIYARRTELVEEINLNRRNSRYHPELELHDSIRAVSDLREVVHEADIALLSVPSKSMDHVCSELARVITEETALLSTTKGIRSDGFKLMSCLLYTSPSPRD